MAIRMVRNSDNTLNRVELWGSSTKHPDSVYDYSQFEKSPLIDEKTSAEAWNEYQFLLEIASRVAHPANALAIVKYAYDFAANYVQTADKCSIEEAYEELDKLAACFG